MVALFDRPRVATVAEGGRLEVRVKLEDPGACVRIAAAGDRNVHQVRLEFLDPDGYRHEGTLSPLSLIGPEGPVCVLSAGQATASARAAPGGGTLAVQVWVAR